MRPFSRSGSDEQLDWLSPRSLDDMERADARIQILAETNTRSLSGVDPARQARINRSREPIRRTVFDRTDAGEFRWVITGFPTNAAAQEAGMSLADYADFVYGAAQLDDDDPIAAWQALGVRIRRLAEWLGTVRELRISSNGTDLRLGGGGPHVDLLRRNVQFSGRGMLHRPARGQRRGRDQLHLSGDLPGPSDRGRAPALWRW